MIHAFCDLGREIASGGWGSASSAPTRDVIQKMPDDRTQVCLLAYACRLLERIARQLERDDDDDESDPSDGILQALLMSRGTLIDHCDTNSLTVRARRAIYRGRFVCVEELTVDSLSGVKNCGSTTIDELMEWKASILNGHVEDPENRPTASTVPPP